MNYSSVMQWFHPEWRSDNFLPTFSLQCSISQLPIWRSGVWLFSIGCSLRGCVLPCTRTRTYLWKHFMFVAALLITHRTLLTTNDICVFRWVCNDLWYSPALDFSFHILLMEWTNQWNFTLKQLGRGSVIFNNLGKIEIIRAVWSTAGCDRRFRSRRAAVVEASHTYWN